MTIRIRIHLTLLLILISTSYLSAQVKQTFPVLFWNVENLFDCTNDSIKSDEDFLPESLKHWTPYRYKQKLKNIAKVIVASSGWSAPAIIGLCEVENDSVIYDLVHRSQLRFLNYKFLVTNSPDKRGIDVALLYQPRRFRVLKQENIHLGKLPGGRTTRDILWVEGKTLSGDTLNVFVVHLPSRFGGQRKSEPNRIFVINKLQKQIAALQERTSGKAKIIVMGDFNDYPSNRSIQKLINPKEKGPTLHHLLAHKYKNEKLGTYKYKNSWGLLDHMLVSPALLDSLQGSFYTSEEKSNIADLPFLLTEDKKFGGHKPFRTYNGMHYQGGFSDHLPIISFFTESLEE